MKKSNLLFVIASVAIMSSCSEDKMNTDQSSLSVPVRLSDMMLSDSNHFVSASGKTEAEKSANISTRMIGYVEKVHVKVGQNVSTGQSLISINNSDLVAKQAQAEAGVIQAIAGHDNAKKDYDRFVRLFEQKSASQKELDDMTTRFEVSKANLESAKQMLNEVRTQFTYSNISAPFNGVVTNTFVKEGDMANPGMPLVSIEGESQMQVTAMVSESDITKIKDGMAVTVLVKSLKKEVKGTVTEISRSSKNSGGQFLVKITLESSKEILSGMFVNVKFPVSENSHRNSSSEMMLVPVSALVKQGQLTGIYTVSGDSVAILRWLRVGKQYGDWVQVLSGLSADENYIISSDGKLYNGAKVSINQK